MQGDPTRRSPARVLLLLCAALCTSAALLANEWSLAAFDAERVAEVRGRIRATQLALLGAALVLGACSELVLARSPRLERSLRAPLAKVLLGLLPALTLVAVAEAVLRPLVHQREGLTTIYEKDAELGWRHRPNARDRWGGVEVAINAKGLRGPELPYAKPPGVRRVLFLGDSVTFGYKLARSQDSYPYRVEAELEARTGAAFETINAGVGGYSPWQEHLFLEREGIRYGPDLVVVGFVLNDVTEKYQLLRFGGWFEGYQLHHTVARGLDASGIVHFLREWNARRRFGEDVQEGAVQHELLRVKMLVHQPERPSIQEAWRTTLRNLEKLYAFCAARGVPVCVVSFPYVFQFEDRPRMGRPHATLAEHAGRHGVRTLDLRPLLIERARAEGTLPAAYFVDADHLSVRGSQVVGELVASFLLEEGLLED